VKIHFSYCVEDIAKILGVHKNTVRTWLRSGLQAIDERRPVMVQGKVLRTFLEKRRSSNRQPCPPRTLFCLKCRAPRKPALGMVDFAPLNVSSGNLRALCEECGTLMHRAVSRARISATMPDLDIRFAEPDERLMESSACSLNCVSKRA
jgi:hypothetical protein